MWWGWQRVGLQLANECLQLRPSRARARLEVGRGGVLRLVPGVQVVLEFALCGETAPHLVAPVTLTCEL